MREKGSLWCFAFGQGAEIVEPAARVWKHVELDEVERVLFGMSFEGKISGPAFTPGCQTPDRRVTPIFR